MEKALTANDDQGNETDFSVEAAFDINDKVCKFISRVRLQRII